MKSKINANKKVEHEDDQRQYLLQVNGGGKLYLWRMSNNNRVANRLQNYNSETGSGDDETIYDDGYQKYFTP